MSPDEVLRSAANPLLKRVGAVAAGKQRDTLLLEGERLVRDALGAGLELELVLLAEDWVGAELERDLAGAARTVRRVEASLLERVTTLETSPGILALAARPAARLLEREPLAPDALLLVAAGIGDPGNLGALARSAEAAGAAGLVALDGCASPWRPKALRGSMGSLLRLPALAAAAGNGAREVRGALETLGFRSVRAEAHGGRSYTEFDWRGRVALWIGGETGELPAEARPFEPLTIPLAGAVESLNVTVAASLLLFAAGRVRGGERAR